MPDFGGMTSTTFYGPNPPPGLPWWWWLIYLNDLPPDWWWNRWWEGTGSQPIIQQPVQQENPPQEGGQQENPPAQGEETPVYQTNPPTKIRIEVEGRPDPVEFDWETLSKLLAGGAYFLLPGGVPSLTYQEGAKLVIPEVPDEGIPTYDVTTTALTDDFWTPQIIPPKLNLPVGPGPVTWVPPSERPDIPWTGPPPTVITWLPEQTTTPEGEEGTEGGGTPPGGGTTPGGGSNNPPGGGGPNIPNIPAGGGGVPMAGQIPGPVGSEAMLQSLFQLLFKGPRVASLGEILNGLGGGNVRPTY